MSILSWPNAISLLRIPLAAAFLAVEGTTARAVILVIAWVSDAVDGRIARRTGRTTRSGELLDPVADRVFALTVLGTFVIEGRLAGWELVALLIRDLYTTTAFAVAMLLRLPLRFRARRSGKLVTGLQVATALVLLLAPDRALPLIVAAGAAGVYAVFDYTHAGIIALRRGGDGP